jgi:hypothetical protein
MTSSSSSSRKFPHKTKLARALYSLVRTTHNSATPQVTALLFSFFLSFSVLVLLQRLRIYISTEILYLRKYKKKKKKKKKKRRTKGEPWKAHGKLICCN